MKSIYRSDEGEAAIRSWCEDRLTTVEMPHRTQMLESGLGETRITIFDNDAPDLILLPGTNFNTAAWIELAVTLAQKYRVASIDLPGQPGLSSSLRHHHANDLYGVWLAQIVKSLDIGPCIVVGHSLGARTALAAAVHIPDLRGVVALDPAGIIKLRITANTLLRSGRWFRHKDADATRELLALMMAPGAVVPEHLVEWMTLVAKHVRTTLAPPPLPAQRLRQIDVPVRVIVGEHDVFLPQRRLRRGVRKMKDVSLAFVENAGHLMPLEHPDVVVASARASQP